MGSSFQLHNFFAAPLIPKLISLSSHKKRALRPVAQGQGEDGGGDGGGQDGAARHRVRAGRRDLLRAEVRLRGLQREEEELGDRHG